MKFRSSQAGYITAIRFYKGNLDTGTHVGHLWTSDRDAPRVGAVHRRDRLRLAGGDARRRPVAIAANTTYVASYHSTPGYYVATDGLLRRGGHERPAHGARRRHGRAQRPLPVRSDRLPDAELQQLQLLGGRRLQREPAGPGHHPADGRVDDARERCRRRPRRRHRHARRFSEPLAPSTVTGTTVQLRDPGGLARPGDRHLGARARSRRPSSPTSALAYSTTYTATVKGGSGRRHGRRRATRSRRTTPGRSPPRPCRPRRPTRGRAGRSSSSATPATPSRATTPRSCGPRA